MAEPTRLELADKVLLNGQAALSKTDPMEAIGGRDWFVQNAHVVAAALRAAEAELDHLRREWDAIAKIVGHSPALSTVLAASVDAEIARLKNEALHYTEIADAQCKMAAQAEAALAETRRMLEKARAVCAKSLDPRYVYVADASLIAEIDATLSRHLTPPESK